MILLHRSGRVAAGLIITAAALLYWIWGNNQQVGLVTGDAASYLTMARAYASHGQDEVAASSAAQSRFPPLYPLLLARLGAANDIARAHSLTVACLLLAFAALWMWLYSSGVGPLSAALHVAAFAALPDVWLAALSIQSEYLYTLLSLAVLLFLVRFQANHRASNLYAAALLTTLAILTRSAGLPLLLPLFVASRGLLLIRQRIVIGAAVVAPLALWYGLHRSGYGSTFGRLLATSLPAMEDLIQRQIGALHTGYDSAVLLYPAWLLPAVDAVAMVCLAALGWRLRRLAPDALYASAYLGMLLFWPYPGDAHRLLWPILPVLLAQPALAWCERPPDSLSQRSWMTAVVPSATLVLVAPSLTFAMQRYADAANRPEVTANPTWYWPDRDLALRFASSEQTLLQALAKIPQSVPAGECVIATRPEWVDYFGQRRGWAPPAPDVPEPLFTAALAASGCHYVFMTPFIDRSYGESMYPLARINDHLVPIDYVYIPDPTSAGKKIEFILGKYELPTSAR